MKGEMIKIIDTDGTELEVEVISILDIDIKRYLVYTKKEKQRNGNLIIYITKLRVKDGVYYIQNITDDEEWDKVKSTMGRLVNR